VGYSESKAESRSEKAKGRAMTTHHVQKGDTPAEEAGDEIVRHLELWAEKGLVTPEEAAAIREFESAGGEVGPKRIAPIIQALLYMGTALTLAALGTIYWQLYEDLPSAARVTIPALLAALLATAGWFTARRTDPDIRRFGGVLWLLSTGAFAGFMSEMIMPDELAGDWSLFLVGAGAAVWAGFLAIQSPQATTQIGVFGTAVTAMVGVPFALSHGFAVESDIAWLTLALGPLGVGWIIAGRSRVLQPAVLADVLGAALLLYAQPSCSARLPMKACPCSWEAWSLEACSEPQPGCGARLCSLSGPWDSTPTPSGRSGFTSATRSECQWCC
jgi:hypothetical protein